MFSRFGTLARGACGSVLALALGIGAAEAKCVRLAFTVNDYGKEGPTKDAKTLLDKHIASWTAARGIKTYSAGKKDVTCELFLDFGVFDEHTCKAASTVCWADGPGVAAAVKTKGDLPATEASAVGSAKAAQTAAGKTAKAAGAKKPVAKVKAAPVDAAPSAAGEGTAAIVKPIAPSKPAAAKPAAPKAVPADAPAAPAPVKTKPNPA